MDLTLIGIATARIADTWSMHDGGWWPVMWTGMLLFWIALIAVAVWLVRGVLARPHERRDESALERLDRGLAEGTISPVDYRERRALLTGRPAPPDTADDQAGG